MSNTARYSHKVMCSTRSFGEEMLSANSLMLLSCIFTTALISFLIMVPFLHRWGVKHEILDLPDERKVHHHAIPRLGGIAICGVLVLTLLLYVDLQREIRGILAGVLIIFFTGLMDDLHGISPLRKFFSEICAVLATMTIGNLYIRTLGDLFGTGEIILPYWLAISFTLVAIVGVVNAFNLIDGLDGLSGGVSVITLVAFGVLAFQTANYEGLVLCAALLGSVLGFLKYNFFPARIFMGDSGSLVIGFVISFLSLHLTQGSTGQVQPVVPLLIIGLPVADTLWVMISRLCARQSPFVADRTHVHHKFLKLGFSHRNTVFLLYIISLLCAIIAVSFRNKQAELLFGGYIVTSLLFYLALHFLSTRQHLFGLLGRESTSWIRQSESYRLFSSLLAKTAPPMHHCFFFAYLVLALIAGNSEEVTSRLAVRWGSLPLICIMLLTAAWFISHQIREFNRRNLGYLILGLSISMTVMVLSNRDLQANRSADAWNNSLYRHQGDYDKSKYLEQMLV